LQSPITSAEIHDALQTAKNDVLNKKVHMRTLEEDREAWLRVLQAVKMYAKKKQLRFSDF
jgi:hypothetical protein